MNSVKTFSSQGLLPRLPVPRLEDTIAKYLLSCEPLVTPAAYETTRTLAAEFVAGPGRALQDKLVTHEETLAAAGGGSWLERWWFDKAYLEYRAPTPVNVNWYCVNPPHPRALGQVARAAGVIVAAREWKQMLDLEQIAPEMIKSSPLCMDQLTRVIGTSRIPDTPGDRIVVAPPSRSQHVLVLVDNVLFSVPTTHDGSPLNIGHLIAALERCKANAAEKPAQFPIPVLTSEHRDVWAAARRSLCSIPSNQSLLEEIDAAMLAISIDRATPSTPEEAAMLVLGGEDGNNRWFDKSLDFVVFANGTMGVNGEHSPQDAPAPTKLVDFVLDQESHVSSVQVSTDIIVEPRRLEFEVPDDVQALFTPAAANISSLLKNTALTLLDYRVFGADAIKACQASPDAFVQAALQLAHYRVRGHMTATYETASTRQFFHGRTECVRSASMSQKCFVNAMTTPGISKSEREAALRKAIASHGSLMTDASSGRGIDRHLMGLRILDREETASTFFKDPSYSITSTFSLSTSNMSSARHSSHMGFGAVVPNGYGVCYIVRDSIMYFSITAFRDCPQTDVARFRAEINVALSDCLSLLTT